MTKGFMSEGHEAEDVENLDSCCHIMLLIYYETALTLPSVLWHCWLSIRKSIWPVKNWVMRCLCDYLSGSKCKWFAGPADATVTPSSFAWLKFSTVLPLVPVYPGWPGKEAVKWVLLLLLLLLLLYESGCGCIIFTHSLVFLLWWQL